MLQCPVKTTWRGNRGLWRAPIALSPALAAMSKKKSTGRPKRLRGVKSNMVAAAVELAGGVTAVSRLCGVTRQSVYTWIQEWRVERLIERSNTRARFGNPGRAPGRRRVQAGEHSSRKIAPRISPSPTRTLNRIDAGDSIVGCPFT